MACATFTLACDGYGRVAAADGRRRGSGGSGGRDWGKAADSRIATRGTHLPKHDEHAARDVQQGAQRAEPH